jgi:hypothetical protein
MPSDDGGMFTNHLARQSPHIEDFEVVRIHEAIMTAPKKLKIGCYCITCNQPDLLPCTEKRRILAPDYGPSDRREKIGGASLKTKIAPKCSMGTSQTLASFAERVRMSDILVAPSLMAF